jgi:hypothetical protein
VLEWCTNDKNNAKQTEHRDSSKIEPWQSTFFQALDENMIFEIVYAADYMGMVRLLNISSHFAAMMNPDLCKSPAALRVRSITQLEELVSLERKHQILTDNVLSLKYGGSMLEQLDSLKSRGVILQERIDPNAYHKKDISKTLILTLSREIELLEKTLEWSSNRAISLEVALGLGSDVYTR